MSLIHDALQKAQKEAGPEKKVLGAQAYLNDEPEKKSSQKRTIILGVILVIAVGFFIYMRFVPKTEPVQGSAGNPAVPMEVKTSYGKEDLGMLKKKAADAYKADDFETAWTSLSTALQLDSTDPEIYNNLGLVAKKRGDNAKAKEYYQKALELKPNYVEAMNNLAVLEWDSENLTGATDLLNKALEIAPSYPEANFHMALIYDEKGNKQKSAEFYKRFLNVAGSFPSNVVDSVRDRLMEIGE